MTAPRAGELDARLAEIRTRYNAVDVSIPPSGPADSVLIASWEDIPELLEMVAALAVGASSREEPTDAMIDAALPAIASILDRNCPGDDWRHGQEERAILEAGLRVALRAALREARGP